ncbi:hypothetical protein RND81_08G209900 [Saponaria officinalis]|uniref:BUB1 N-terminal domain-containing protein n=1 Tax=Saponaria officinalis TaxID=3572 RepID=A0AAW1JA81_SAPOF
MTAKTTTNDIFTAIISDIKSYSGDDPLLPWLRGIRKLRDTLSPQLLQEKLPRFLQKCAQSFDSDRRYRNDLRYLRIWLQLMDYADDPKALLRNMETKKIGIKRALFYQAYALYYEKLKKFDGADQMYRLGVQNLAEPLDELQKSYDEFLQRLERHKHKRVQRREQKIARRPLSDRESTNPVCSFKENDENSFKVDKNPEKSVLKECSLGADSKSKGKSTECDMIEQSKLYRDDSVVSKFADSAIVGRSEVEDACHHGLVEPTINMKEAMNAINNMFREPIEPSNAVRRSSKSLPKKDDSTSNVFKVFINENSESAVRSSRQQDDERHKTHQSVHEPLKIFVDDEASNDSEPSESQTSSTDGSPSSSVDAFVFLRPNDHHSESSNDMKLDKSSKKTRTNFREDTVVRRFVGSAILDEPQVEDICHHGLVDPTVNLKEAMEDINGMFGKPIDFVRTTRRKRQEKTAAFVKNDYGGFSILPDDEFNADDGKQPPETSSAEIQDDLYEPTVFTKEAMDDINDLFRMPLDF